LKNKVTSPTAEEALELELKKIQNSRFERISPSPALKQIKLPEAPQIQS